MKNTRFVRCRREGWAEAARLISEAGDDELVLGEFGNSEDIELSWPPASPQGFNS